jgi:ABC-2 type transport system permease protein
MRIIDLASKDLSQMLRDRRSLLFLVAMPIVFTIFMGFAYRGGSSSAPQDNRLSLAWVDGEPGGKLSAMLFDRLSASDALKPLPMDEAAALDALGKNKVDGVLIIPAGFSSQILAGTPAQLKLLADTSSAKGQTLYQALRGPVSQLMSAVEIAQISADMNPSADHGTEKAAAFELAWTSWGNNQTRSFVRIEQAVAQKSPDWTGGNPYNQASPGILVQFAIFGLVTSAQILVAERKSRTLQRLMTTAMRPWEIVAGHMLAMFAIGFMQTALLVIFGQLALNVNYLREPLGTLLVSVALGLWVASMGLLIGIVAKGEDQVILFSMLAMFVFSALGGTWFPLEASGSGFAIVGKLMPSAWAMTGFQNILIRGLGLDAAWLPAGVLCAYAIGFFLLAVWRFGKLEA